MAHVMGPKKCHLGEQLGLRLHIFNNEPNEMLVKVVLLGSPDYKFVHVERNGLVSSYGARLSHGDKETLIYMNPESQTEINFPVAPSPPRLGSIEISFLISSQAGRVALKHPVEILGGGAFINKHTSLLLDLKNRAFVLSYFDIVVEKSPIVPYEHWRRYVFGTPIGSITVTRDLIGIQLSKIPFTSTDLLRQPLKGAADALFELHSNIWSLHYLRLTNQLGSLGELAGKVLTKCSTKYAQLMRYCNLEGACSYWETNKNLPFQPNLWLTAQILRTLKQASFSDWEYKFYVDPKIFTKGATWILTRQSKEGSFHEVKPQKTDDVSLTSHVLLTLQAICDVVEDGNARSNMMAAANKARMFLERRVIATTDAAALSIMAYALMTTDSPEKEFAFAILRSTMRLNAEGEAYWSTVGIPANSMKLQNHRFYQQPRAYAEGLSAAVEATSWALLNFLSRDATISPISEQIVHWLMSVRMATNSFVSFPDTIVAYEALTEFAFRSRMLEITNIRLDVECSSSSSKTFHLKNFSLEDSHVLKLDTVWGRVNFIAKGSGLAVIQMDVGYGIEEEFLVEKAARNSFQLNITEYYFSWRNKSAIVVQSCFRYVAGGSENASLEAALEMQLPTGYGLVESEAMKLISREEVRQLRDVRSTEGKITWFFDFIDVKWGCFNYTIRRWHPTANITLYRQASLYEISAREKFVQVLINSTPLYILNICEVCGSFQCPYCPFYNNAAELQKTVIFWIVFNFIFIFY